MNKFTVKQNLANRSICDSNCIFKAVVVKRTAKTVTIEDNEGVRRCKIHLNDTGEYIYPYGRYSMATIFRA